MYLNPGDRPRYCWKCRRRIGQGLGPLVCDSCRTYNRQTITGGQHKSPPDIEERIAYYAARAEQGLDLFPGSPWTARDARIARGRESEAKGTGASGAGAAADQIEQSTPHVPFRLFRVTVRGGRQ